MYFPHLYNGRDNTSLKALLGKVNKIADVSTLVCHLTHRRQLISSRCVVVVYYAIILVLLLSFVSTGAIYPVFFILNSISHNAVPNHPFIGSPR